MTTTPVASNASNPTMGRLSRALIHMFMKHARIVGAESVAEDFRLIALESPGFKGLQWTPGQKLQIAMGSGFSARTFTPIEWDASAGRTRILGYVHGNGPGSAWVRDIQPGDECDVFGPRASLDVSKVTGSCILIGDETSIGLVYALSRATPGSPVQCLLEVNSLANTREALLRLGLDNVDLFGRAGNDAHLGDIEQRLSVLEATGATFVLTGKAASIQRLRRALKVLGVPGFRLATKPYWAPGKSGLD
ncbi:MAG: siderophore-interacting protein [Pseudoxanthomonas sp.]